MRHLDLTGFPTGTIKLRTFCFSYVQPTAAIHFFTLGIETKLKNLMQTIDLIFKD